MYHNEKNMFIMSSLKKSANYQENPSLSHLIDEFRFLGKWWKIKAFQAKPKHQNYAYQ